MALAFTQYEDGFYVSAQITAADIARAKDLGIGAIIKNRPDFEEAGQPETAPLLNACHAADIAFIDLPVDQTGITSAHLDHFDAIRAAHASILAYCRSGMRSALVYSMARARQGENIETIIRHAGTGGFDLRPYEGSLKQLAP